MDPLDRLGEQVGHREDADLAAGGGRRAERDRVGVRVEPPPLLALAVQRLHLPRGQVHAFDAATAVVGGLLAGEQLGIDRLLEEGVAEGEALPAAVLAVMFFFKPLMAVSIAVAWMRL